MKIIYIILLFSIISCENTPQEIEKNSKAPKVEFDLSNMPKNLEAKPNKLVNDLEKIFTKNQINELENYLGKIKTKTGKQIVILTVPFNEKVEKKWSIDNGITNKGILITISKSHKIIGIGTENDIKEIIPENTREQIIKKTIIPEFEKGKYYNGVKKGIEKLIIKLN